jgi:hypothetical protein
LSDPHNKSVEEASTAYDTALRSICRTIMLGYKKARMTHVP